MSFADSTRKRCRELSRIGASAAACVLVGFAHAATATDPAYLAELPDAKRVAQDFKGSDRLDTLALQIAALTRLGQIVTEMAGDRYYTPGKYPTPDEARALAAIKAAAEPLAAEAETAFDPKARGADTPRQRWRNKSREYAGSDELNARLMQLYFTPAFRSAHEAGLTAKARSQQKGREELQRGKDALDGKTEPKPPPAYAQEILFGAAMLALCLLGGLRMLRRPKLKTTAPHRVWLGFKRYTVETATGVIANYSHHEIRGRRDFSVVPGQTPLGSGQTDEQFTLDGPHGSEPFYLVSLTDLAPRLLERKIGQSATAAWITSAGKRLFLAIHVRGERDPVTHVQTDTSMEELFSRPWWTLVPAVLLAYVIGDLAIGSEYSGAIAGLIAMVVWEIIYKVLFPRRSSDLEEQVNLLVKGLSAAAR